MKGLFTLLLSLLMATAAFAYDFDNTYFKGSIKLPNGTSSYMYLELQAGGKATIAAKLPGQKIQKDSGAKWENNSIAIIVKSPGETNYFSINYEDTNTGAYVPYLVLDNAYGQDVEFHMISEETYKKETTSAPASNKTARPAARKKRR